jgi:branched-chain amino acid transport system permease protein
MRRDLAGYATVAICAVFFALLPFALSDYHRGIAAEVAVYLIAILGLDVLVGYTGQISIGHSAFMMIGGYTTAIMSHYHHTNLIATMPLAFAITFGCGVLLGLPALRLSGVYLALATFALAVSVPQLPLKFSKFTNGSAGISANHSVSNTWLYAVSWATAAIAFVFTWVVLRGRTGRAFRAIRDSEVAATSSGVTLAIYKTLAFGVSAALAGVAGSLFVLVTNGFAQPNEFSVTLSLKILIGAAVAGLGSLWGVLVGAAFIALLPSISASAPLIGSAHGQDVVFGIFVIVVMLLLPTGVAGLLPRLRRLRSRA